MLVIEISIHDMMADERLNDIFSPEAIEILYNFYYNISEESETRIMKYNPIHIKNMWREETISELKDGDCAIEYCDYEEVLNYLDMHTVFYELKNGKILYREYKEY